MMRYKPHAFVVATAMALAGCAPWSGSSNTHPKSVEVTRHPAGTIAITTTYRSGRMGFVYREGAMAAVILRDADGKIVEVRTKQPGTPMTFTNVKPGRYILEPALRPCDGNCGYLDPRLDGCSGTLLVDRRVHIRVDFVVGFHCRIHTV